MGSTNDEDRSKSEKQKLKRRDFLTFAGIAGVSAAVAPSILTSKKAHASPIGFIENPIYRDAIVIGSGFGGSITSLRLSQAGIETLLLEKVDDGIENRIVILFHLISIQMVDRRG